MGTILRRNIRMVLAISLLAALFALTAACGGSPAESPVLTNSTTSAIVTPAPNIATATQVTSISPDEAAVETPAKPTPTAMAQAPEPTEPVLINTPVPVTADLAPDFTLPSIQGTEYTLSDFRGEQPVLVVFYRAYW
jgi:hypothetical protein